ncbi:hypothetical protein MKX96_16330 [Psychrobacillus sp. FSL W7-1493]|uniref:hypothetical protein n=1 Tax=Psychrobacillus sp. FSL W7-1493 TaxID=2921552 RepID=UPI0030FC1CF6
MKRNYILSGVILILLVGGILLYNYFSKELTVGDVLEENNFSKEAAISVQKLKDGKIIPIQVSDDKQKDLVRLFEDLKLIKSDERYPVLDADYIIAPKSNYSQKLYVFLDENVIVFSEKTSDSYVIQNKDFTQTIKRLLD